MLYDHRDDRTIQANIDEVLEALHKSLKEHKEIVAEANAGYLKKAGLALKKRAKLIRDGRPVSLSFGLTPPESHVRDFKMMIKMVEVHRDAGNKTFELKPADVRRIFFNDWDWMQDFARSNAVYSVRAAALSETLG